MKKFSLSLPSAVPSTLPKPSPVLPTREAERSGRNQSSPTSSRSPTNAMVAGLTAPPNASVVIAVDAPPRPFAFMPYPCWK
jgi:hypothetical protein